MRTAARQTFIFTDLYHCFTVAARILKIHAVRILFAFPPFSDNSFETGIGPRGVSNDNYSYGRIIAYRQPEISGTGVRIYFLDSRRENGPERREERTIADLPSGFGKRPAAERKDPRHLSGRLSLFCRSASGYSPHVVLGQEVRLRSGRNLSRGATLSPSLSHPSSPPVSISFHPSVVGGEQKGFARQTKQTSSVLPGVLCSEQRGR